jgi:hypothetical protein
MTDQGKQESSSVSSSREGETPPRRRDEALLRKTVSTLCHFIWHRRTRPGDHLWSIPVDKERDFDCILSDAIDELVELRKREGETPQQSEEKKDECLLGSTGEGNAKDWKPVAQSFHPSEYIREEMEARGWSRDQLAYAMVADDDKMSEEWPINRLAIDLYFEVGPTNPSMRMGEDAARSYARAFGVSEGLFLNLERSWLQAQEGRSAQVAEPSNEKSSAFSDQGETPAAPVEQSRETILSWLRKMQSEIRAEGHYGWGNTLDDVIAYVKGASPRLPAGAP